MSSNSIETTPEKDTKKVLRDNIKLAIKKGDVSYLRGVLQVEEKLGKPERVQWLKEQISKIQEMFK